MSDHQIIAGDIRFPELEGKVMAGRLHISPQDSYLVVYGYPYGRETWKPISIAFIKTNHSFYSCVQCLLIRIADGECHYAVSELYFSEQSELSLDDLFSQAQAEIYYLNTWLHPRLSDIKHPDDKSYYADVRVKNESNIEYKIDGITKVRFDSWCSFNLARGRTLVREVSKISIIKDPAAGRSEIFSYYYSFLIFFSLFVEKPTKTVSLEFIGEDDHQKLLQLDPEIEDTPSSVLIPYAKIENLGKVIADYFKKREDYDQILNLWKKSFRNFESEITFLHLTQSLELFHKRFYHTDEYFDAVAKAYSVETQMKKPPKKWLQGMMYYHLYLITEQSKLNLPFGDERMLFIKKLTNSRNFYTHHDNDNGIWTHFELHEINIILRTWVRAMVLNQLNVAADLINVTVKREVNRYFDNDIFENKHSMRFKNLHTL